MSSAYFPAKALAEAGIPGAKYYDQGSRSTGAGTQNFVVFDPALIEILRKYGLAGSLGAGTIANALMPDNKEQ